MDLSIETQVDTVGTNLKWLGGTHGIDSGVTGTLNTTSVATLKDAVGILHSGVALGVVTASKLYGLFDPAATDGREVLAGYLLSDEAIVNSKGVALAKIGISVLKHGFIHESKLPVAAQRVQVNAADVVTTGEFIYLG